MNEPLGGDGLVEGGLQGVEQLLLWEDPNLAAGVATPAQFKTLARTSRERLASFLALMRNGDNNNDVGNDD
ncbi:hypothetical protein Pmar_PMAR007364 [Perkinsus marinus ATCC 50983]|uniref:Uncharacterized protein n=1 Tax=Perkinsus marinus (strain ATCC 50983 / TXsc) TaxID=423536 RepID=C5K649_PERM5|nr:hypothetical protein Pmar_PMAR007364 [Perkinsus marinus ATCC 50983]EER20079.1 hypothetical protein Pmar_PMAR007364 [Perkinsus marinus ATCC 50983]|eukprot:XP_002788283.1 hypothetical protein Pmar_PMAR007364 [Perkinsus marinus ATCC 50983]